MKYIETNDERMNLAQSILPCLTSSLVKRSSSGSSTTGEDSLPARSLRTWPHTLSAPPVDSQ